MRTTLPLLFAVKTSPLELSFDKVTISLSGSDKIYSTSQSAALVFGSTLKPTILIVSLATLICSEVNSAFVIGSFFSSSGCSHEINKDEMTSDKSKIYFFIKLILSYFFLYSLAQYVPP